MDVTGTHLDKMVEDTEVDREGYNISRLGNKYGGGIAFYIQSHTPVKIRKDLGEEVLWLQVHFPHVRPLLTCCCYRPPISNIGKNKMEDN